MFWISFILAWVQPIPSLSSRRIQIKIINCIGLTKWILFFRQIALVPAENRCRMRRFRLQVARNEKWRPPLATYADKDVQKSPIVEANGGLTNGEILDSMFASF